MGEDEISEIDEDDPESPPLPKPPVRPDPPEDLDPLRLIESALFMSSRALSTEELAKLTGLGALGHVQELAAKLAEEYSSRGSALEITKEGDGWLMRLRTPYTEPVKQFAKAAELSAGSLKVLAFISKNQPITQSDLVKKLGSTVYERMAELLQKDFVVAKKHGRTKLITTSEKFREYFQS